MSLYTPFELVHAHLAEAPSAPGVVEEITVPSERSFPATEDEYHSPLHAEHAVSAAFDPRTGTLARAIFNGYALEVRSLSPVISPNGGNVQPSVLRVILPDPLRPLVQGCVVSDLGNGQLVVVVVTQADVVYRFTFPLGSFVDQGDRIAFVTKDADWVEEVEIDHETIAAAGGIGSWSVVNPNTLVLGCGDGGIIKAERLSNSKPENPNWTTSHHRGHSRLRLGFFSRPVDEQVTSIAEFDYEDQIPVIYSFSRDSKLRTWSSVTGQCLKTMDVRLSTQELVVASQPQLASSTSSAELSTSLIRVIAHPNPSSRCSHIVVVFIPSPFNPSIPGTFVFYRGSNTASSANDLVYAGERAGSPASARRELRGFEIQPPTRTDAADGWRLWAVWDNKGKLEADSVPINDILQFTTYHEPPTKPRMVFDWQRAGCYDGVERYDTSYFDSILSLDAPDPARPLENDDISDVFIKHLLHPGRFSSLNLTTALEDYISQLSHAQQERLRVVHPSLAARFAAAVGSSLQIKYSPQTGAPVVSEFRAELKQQWLGIWARVCELDKQGRWPVATTSVNGQLLVLDREGASAPQQEDTSGVLVHLGRAGHLAAELQALPEGALVALYPILAPPRARRALTAAAIAGETMSNVLRESPSGDGSASALDALLEHLNTELSAPAQVPPEEFAGSLWDDMVDPYLSEETRNHVTRALSESVNGVPRTLSETLDILSTYPGPASGSQKSENLSLAGFGNALLASSVSAVINDRFALARDVLLVALFYMATSSDLSEDDEASETLIEVIARALVTYHRYHVLSWLSQKTGAEAGNRAKSQAKWSRGKDDVLAAFDSLRMRESDDKGVDADGYEMGYSLLHSLLASRLAQQVPKDTVASLFDMACAFLGDLGLVGSEQFDVEPRGADVELAYTVLVEGHAATAGEMTNLYPMSSGTAYVHGLALVEVGQVESGAGFLERASAGCRDGSLTAINPAWSGKKALGSYFHHVMTIVEQRNLWVPVARFGERALQALDAVDEKSDAAKDIWTRIFLAYLQLGQYEDAYSTLTSAPFPDMKRDLLGQLISSMCEANEIGRLNSLGFIGFQKEVEERLNFKARNSDPLRTPNYYDVLYSWHISRGDYRSAGETMYAKAVRFGEASTTRLNRLELAAFRARSYLGAINALSLVDKRNAWISVTVPASRSAKKRRVTSNIPEEAFSHGVPAVDIITLADMRAEYRTVLSQLQLCHEVPDLLAGNVTLSPDEIIGFFTQRDKFDEAQLAAAELGVDMTDLFVVLATRCVELARSPHLRRDSAQAAFLKSPSTARLRGPPAALALRYLQIALSRHDSAATRWKYTAAVADTFFSLNEDAARGWSMPAWLVQGELQRDAEGWIARALRFGWVAEALDWAADALRHETPAENLKKKDGAVDTPYNLYDRVLAACEQGEEKSDARVQASAKALRETVERRIAGTRRVAKV